IINQEDEDSDIKKLYDTNYLIPYDFDEKAVRKLKYIEKVAGNVLYLVIHTTTDCNFRCQYCALDFEKKHMSLDTQEAVISFVRKNIHKYSSVNIGWFGGEPLLQMDVIENISSRVIEICKKAHKSYAATITTNGYLLTSKNIDKLISLKVLSYTVTLDGLKDIHDSMRVLKGGEATFEKLIHNLEYIRDNYKSRTIHITLRSNLTESILKRLDEYYEFFNSKFGDDSRFSLFVRPVGNWGGESVKKLSKTLIPYETMAEVYHGLAGYIDKITFDGNFDDMQPGGSTCTATYLNKFTIGVDGLVGKCDTAPNVSEAIGLLKGNGEMVLDQSKHAQWVTSCFDDNIQCEECTRSAICFRGCCIKAKIKDGVSACGFSYNELDALLHLYDQSYLVEII
ncbi:MAG: radical SAM protein, partial [Romboutsia sp.]